MISNNERLIKITSPITVQTSDGVIEVCDVVLEVVSFNLPEKRNSQVVIYCNLYKSIEAWRKKASVIKSVSVVLNDATKSVDFGKQFVSVVKILPTVKDIFIKYLETTYKIDSEDLHLEEHEWTEADCNHRVYLTFEDVAMMCAHRPLDGEAWDGLLILYVKDNNFPFVKNGYGYWVYFQNPIVADHLIVLNKYKAFIQEKPIP